MIVIDNFAQLGIKKLFDKKWNLTKCQFDETTSCRKEIEKINELTYPFSFHPTSDNLESPAFSGVDPLQSNCLDEVSLARHVTTGLKCKTNFWHLCYLNDMDIMSKKSFLWHLNLNMYTGWTKHKINGLLMLGLTLKLDDLFLVLYRSVLICFLGGAMEEDQT